MKRELPNHPNLEHLKAQAKDLLDAHHRREPAALARIREALPAFARATDDAIAAGPFALHDAQSALAREYGFPSFAKLRARVLAAANPYPAELVARLFGGKMAPEVEGALRDAWSKRDLDALDALPTPEELPVVAVRNALASPGALVPLALGRPASLAALTAATRTTPALVALFSQRREDVEHPTADDLHETGCLAVVRRFQTLKNGAWVVLEGVRFIRLERLTSTEPFLSARIAATELPTGDPTEVAGLDAELRDAARKLARTLPQADAALALIDETKDVSRLSDLVVANLPCTVAEKAAYATEPDLASRLRTTLELLERESAKTG
jgi:Lon protease-like protein